MMKVAFTLICLAEPAPPPPAAAHPTQACAGDEVAAAYPRLGCPERRSQRTSL